MPMLDQTTRSLRVAHAPDTTQMIFTVQQAGNDLKVACGGHELHILREWPARHAFGSFAFG
jgi:hypothetical protein